MYCHILNCLSLSSILLLLTSSINYFFIIVTVWGCSSSVWSKQHIQTHRSKTGRRIPSWLCSQGEYKQAITNVNKFQVQKIVLRGLFLFIVLQMVELARTCTQDNPELRPSMRSVVVALNSFSSTTETWDIGSFYEHGLKNLASGR